MTDADRVTSLAKLREFLGAMTRLVSAEGATEERILAQGRPMLAELVRHDDWLPDMFAQPDPRRYMQYLLYCDPPARFSVVSFVWARGRRRRSTTTRSGA